MDIVHVAVTQQLLSEHVRTLHEPDDVRVLAVRQRVQQLQAEEHLVLHAAQTCDDLLSLDGVLHRRRERQADLPSLAVPPLRIDVREVLRHRAEGARLHHPGHDPAVPDAHCVFEPRRHLARVVLERAQHQLDAEARVARGGREQLLHRAVLQPPPKERFELVLGGRLRRHRRRDAGEHQAWVQEVRQLPPRCRLQQAAQLVVHPVDVAADRRVQLDRAPQTLGLWAGAHRHALQDALQVRVREHAAVQGRQHEVVQHDGPVAVRHAAEEAARRRHQRPRRLRLAVAALLQLHRRAEQEACGVEEGCVRSALRRAVAVRNAAQRLVQRHAVREALGRLREEAAGRRRHRRRRRRRRRRRVCRQHLVVEDAAEQPQLFRRVRRFIEGHGVARRRRPRNERVDSPQHHQRRLLRGRCCLRPRLCHASPGKQLELHAVRRVQRCRRRRSPCTASEQRNHTFQVERRRCVVERRRLLRRPHVQRHVVLHGAQAVREPPVQYRVAPAQLRQARKVVQVQRPPRRTPPQQDARRKRHQLAARSGGGCGSRRLPASVAPAELEEPLQDRHGEGRRRRRRAPRTARPAVVVVQRRRLRVRKRNVEVVVRTAQDREGCAQRVAVHEARVRRRVREAEVVVDQPPQVLVRRPAQERRGVRGPRRADAADGVADEGVAARVVVGAALRARGHDALLALHPHHLRVRLLRPPVRLLVRRAQRDRHLRGRRRRRRLTPQERLLHEREGCYELGGFAAAAAAAAVAAALGATASVAGEG
eukprot:Rhum_TRINITY_DN14356_c6_g1::Rhum_TRINITY_DN14356_c6_g1_i1::g.84579::m.84579